jgi:hypothetical protein
MRVKVDLGTDRIRGADDSGADDAGHRQTGGGPGYGRDVPFR